MINGAPVVLTLDKNKTPRQRASDFRAPLRNGRRVAGGWIADMVSLKRAIALCQLCRPKFDAPYHGYITKPQMRFVRGKCDGCQEYGDKRHFLFHQDAIPR